MPISTKKNTIIIVIACLLTFTPSSAQNWIRGMQDTNVNFYDVQKEFKLYWEKIQENDNGMVQNDADEWGEENGFTLYKRWEEFTEPRVYPSGKMLDPSFVPREYAKYFSQLAQSPAALTVQSNWSLIGPIYKDCIGDISFVRIHPTNPNIIYAGAASGGLWKSTDGGVTWATKTDTLGTLGMADMAFDPTNPNTIYLGTGGGGGYAIGLLKSTDGGNTWKPTGLNNLKMSSVIVNPANPSVVLASTPNDVYRSTNGGATFQKVLSSTLLRNLMFKPGDPKTMYVTSWNTFYRSTDSGVSFTAITSGLPTPSNLIRIAIATTPADPNYVYVLASSLAASDFYGLYLSTDAGLTFTEQSSAPNIVGGQGWFALCIAASPTNKAEVVVGGLDIYRSLNSGTTWSKISSWNVPKHTGAVHVDMHDLQYLDSTTIFAGCDGGLFKTANSGSNWSNLSSGLQVTQSYSVGISQKNANLIMIGTQDNGTKTFDGTQWIQNIGGDGAICFIDWSNDTFRYASLPQGWLAASVNYGGSYTTIGSTITESTNAYLIPWFQDPDSSKTLYAGYTNVWKSTDRGSIWAKISNFGGGGVKVIAVCSGQNNCLCAVTGNKLYRTTNGGTNWGNITGTLPVGSASISDVVIKNNDSNKIWVIFSGVSNGNKVYETPDGGKTWNNISGTLPNLPANTLAYQPNSPEGLYLGMDIGVYYRDSILNTWNLFNTGLPNAVVRQLKIQRAAGKLRACTYGRGIWETDLYTNNPTSVSAISNKTYCGLSLTISPNPVSGNLNVSFLAAERGNYSLELRNTLGKLIYREELNNFVGEYSKQLNTDLYMKGVYLVSIVPLSNREKQAVKKVIIY